MSIGNIYIQSAVQRLASYKELGDKTFAQLTEADFFTSLMNKVIVLPSLYNTWRAICLAAGQIF